MRAENLQWWEMQLHQELQFIIVDEPLSKTKKQNCIHMCWSKLYCSKRSLISVLYRAAVTFSGGIRVGPSEWKLCIAITLYSRSFQKKKKKDTRCYKTKPKMSIHAAQCIFLTRLCELTLCTHTTETWMRTEKVQVLHWPACNRDQSPNESVLLIFKQKKK